MDDNLHSPQRRLIELRIEHADLDSLIDRMTVQTPIDDLVLRRLKKRRLSNKELNRIASGFGLRIHPIYGIAKMHQGLDFTAPQGTPIYATGDGVVTTSGFNAGAGNEVVIYHGYGYETKYLHMVRIKARSGQRVKRGEVIGWVGNTGASTGPHCHYEVHINGNPVNPVYFFFNDLNAAQYDQVLKIAATGSAKSFD